MEFISPFRTSERLLSSAVVHCSSDLTILAISRLIVHIGNLSKLTTMINLSYRKRWLDDRCKTWQFLQPSCHELSKIELFLRFNRAFVFDDFSPQETEPKHIMFSGYQTSCRSRSVKSQVTVNSSSKSWTRLVRKVQCFSDTFLYSPSHGLHY